MNCQNHQNCGPVKLLITSLFTFLFQTIIPAEAAPPVVAITQIISHPALNKQRDGIIQALTQAGYVPGETVTILSDDAQGNVATASQIATKFASQAPAVAVGISTPSAQALAIPMGKVNVPVVYTAVTDPVAAKLNISPDKMTGVSCYVPVKLQLQLVQDLVPGAKTVGVIHNPGEANAASTVNDVKKEAALMGLDVVVATATKTSEVKSAADSLVGKVQALVLVDDNTVASSFDAVLSVAKTNKIPIFSSDLDLIKRGALAGKAVDHAELGQQAGRLVVRLLKGESVQAIAPQNPETIALYFNEKSAATLGIQIPEKANKIKG